LLGGILWGIVRLSYLIPWSLWPEGTAVLVVITGTVLTRGLHLDGLADWADGFWGGKDREDVLKVMKDPRVGTFGSLALVLVLLAKWVFLTRLVAEGTPIWIIAAYIVSRTCQVDLAGPQPYARPEGGIGGAFIRKANLRHAALAAVLAGILLLGVCGLNGTWIATLALGLLISRAFGLRCGARIGGVTGDLLGACSEIVETAVLAVGAGFN